MLDGKGPAEHDEWDACVVKVDDGVGEAAGFEEGQEGAVAEDCVLWAGEEGEGCRGDFELGGGGVSILVLADIWDGE